MSQNSMSIRILRHLLVQAKEPSKQTAPLLLASDESPQSTHVDLIQDDLPDFFLSGLPAKPADAPEQDDVSSLSEKLRQVHETENTSDRERDIADLVRMLQVALTAPSYLDVIRILQIPKQQMPLAIVLLLRELERQQQEEQPPEPANGSPSPRIRALSWPLVGIPSWQVSLLHRQFVERELEALKKTVQPEDISTAIGLSSPALLSGSIRRVDSEFALEVSPPSDNNSLLSSEYTDSETGITTPSPTEEGPEEPELETLNLRLGKLEGDLSRFELAPDRPSSPFATITELRYRLSLSHSFHHLGVSLPLWTPSPVEVGAVGYLAKPEGAFRTLFNSRDPPSALGHWQPLAGVAIVHREQTQDVHAGLRARGMKLVDRLRAPGAATAGKDIERTYAISTFGATAHLLAEQAEYRYFQSFDAPRRWFRTNVDAILTAYQGECLKEELFLICGTLNARDHALFVNHGQPDELLETQFQVHASRIPGQAWGAFEPAEAPSDATNDSESDFRQTVRKVSTVDPTARWNTVLLSRLRFRPDEQDPTTQ
ncbi:hypothetical protein GGX14DRAFT_33026 [Mycena pura]|uniref:Uncharacterized protein n=1 Tax=Mycena pura TaxID=153505 RepID=A0AAD6Y4Z3_9AGAR|nr:hypothetical protein GGX14DRAFT_33026 [Mycena pura]